MGFFLVPPLLCQPALPCLVGQLPGVSNPSHLTANVTIFSPSSFFIVVQTGMGLQLQLQLVPIMQVFVRLDPSYHGQMCGEAPAGLRVGPWRGDWLGVRSTLTLGCEVGMPYKRGLGSTGCRAQWRPLHHPAHFTSAQ